jgi:LuxR family maltose regulon positive regulatory protein
MVPLPSPVCRCAQGPCPDGVASTLPQLHERASEWYEQHDLYAEAIRHALAAEDFERAAGLIERVWPTMRRRQRETTVLSWITSLP